VEASCFDGFYITGDVNPDYLARLESARSLPRAEAEDIQRSQLNLNLAERVD
jgi:amidophosphoribosyltransferase